MSKASIGISRRSFLGGSLLGAAGLGVYSRAAEQPAGPVTRPNIVFINVDQLSRDNTITGLGCRHTNTPNIDRLLANGVCFDRSYSADPLCCPARASWWTGKYSSEHGVVYNNTPCHDGLDNVGAALGRSGYSVFYVGKWHFPGCDPNKHFRVLHQGTWWGEISDADVTRAARGMLRNYDESAPFFLTVGYLNPHDVCITALQDLGEETPHLIEDGVLDERVLPPLPPQHEPVFPGPKYMGMRAMGKLNALQWRYYLWTYYRQVEMVDKEVGLLLDELENSPHRDNTLIVFSSDHGEGMARHKLRGKRSLYDETVKVPFIVSTLGDGLSVSKGARDDHLVSGVDFAPTLCDYAGAEMSTDLAGRSLRPLVEGNAPDAWRECVYAESVFYSRMVCTPRYKYILEYMPNEEEDFRPPRSTTHQRGAEQLFDLQAQPVEARNLVDDPAHREVLEAHRALLREEELKLSQRRIPHEAGQREAGKLAEQLRKAYAEG